MLALLSVSFLGALSTTTQGGMYVLTLLENYGTGPAIMTVVLMECIALSWIYGEQSVVGGGRRWLSRYRNVSLCRILETEVVS